MTTTTITLPGRTIHYAWSDGSLNADLLQVSSDGHPLAVQVFIVGIYTVLAETKSLAQVIVRHALAHLEVA